MSFPFHLVLMFWLSKASVLGWIFLSAYLSLYWMIFAFFYKKHAEKYPFCLSCFWVVLESVRAHVFSGFPWLPIGTVLGQFFITRQSVAFLGLGFLSFLVLFLNITLVNHIRFATKSSFRYLFCAISLFFLNALYGGGIWIHKNKRDSLETKSFLRVGLLHSNFSIAEKWEKHTPRDLVDHYCSLSKQFCRKHSVDALLFPETAVPAYIVRETQLLKQMQRLSEEENLAVVFGSLDFIEKPQLQRGAYNCTVVLNGDEKLIQIYRKQKPIPFGEYYPIKKSFPLFSFLFPKGLSLKKGDGSGNPFRINGISCGTLICYEVFFPSLIKQCLGKGIQILIVPTNDAWFFKSYVKQCFDMLKMKALEFHIPIVRVSNSGSSCVINTYGEIVKEVKTGGVFLFDVPYAQK